MAKGLDLDEIYTLTPESLAPTNPQQNFKTTGNFYYCLKPFFILGRFLGVLPISGFFSVESSTSLGHIYFKWKSIAVLTMIPILIILCMNVAFSFLNLFRLFAGSGGGNASQLALAARDPVFYLMGALIYTFFLLRAKSLVSLFTKWRGVTNDLGFTQGDRNLRKDCFICAILIFGFGMIESILYNVNHFPIGVKTREEELKEANFTTLEVYYWRTYPSWATLLPYNPLLCAILLICNVLTACSWNYADIFIVLCSRALYFKFKILVDQTNHRLLHSKAELKEQTVFNKVSQATVEKVPLTWAQVRKDHLTLCKLLEEFEHFLSPLIFLSYSTNIFFICLEIHQGLTPQDHQSPLDSAFSLVSFAHLLLRVMAVSLTAAKINEYAHQITNCIQRCSTKEYCNELERLERMLATGPVGLSGLGCFVITRAFLLMVVSVIFTVEIVLLQATASVTTSATTITPFTTIRPL